MSETPESSAAPRIPPHDLQAEMGVLGSMLLSQDATHLARERLSASSFYKLAHQDIFNAIAELSESSNAADVILLRDQLAKDGRLEKAGGVEYLLELMESVPTSANAEHYIEIVREHALRRSLIETASDIQKRAYDAPQEVDELLDEAESRILAVRAARDTGRAAAFPDVLQRVMTDLEQRHQHPGQLTGMASGYYDLDGMTGGFQPGEFVVMAARPSMGKTSLALNMLLNVCGGVRQRPAVLYTLEMPAEQIANNLLCISGQLDTHRFRVGALEDEEWEELDNQVAQLGNMPLYIDDSATLRVLDLRARARRLVQRHQVALIVVDYLQLLSANRFHESRVTEVSEISQGLKSLARELKIPLIAVAQLSRRVEQEQRQPRLSDLRESGAIEQDADLVLLLHRPIVQGDEDAGPEAGRGKWDGRDGVAPRWERQEELYGADAQLIVAKNRNGPTGVVHLVFRRRYLQFKSAASATTGTTTASW